MAKRKQPDRWESTLSLRGAIATRDLQLLSPPEKLQIPRVAGDDNKERFSAASYRSP